MPIDNIAQISTGIVRPAGADIATPVATPRQNLPGSGQTLPVQAAQGAAVQMAVSRLNDYVQSMQRDIRFSIDKGTGETVIKVVDTNSGETIRQLPSEEVLAIARSLEKAQGLLVNASA